MARKFRIPTEKIKFVNRCIMCGRIIPSGYSICATCNRKRIKNLRKR